VEGHGCDIRKDRVFLAKQLTLTAMWSVDQQLLYILRVDLRSGGHGEPRATVRRRGGPANEAPRGVV
jgi:hypothetical protein